MKKIENMISTKDLSYLEDIFNWNITLKTKIDYYLKSNLDEEIAKELKKISSMHDKICKDITKLLEGCDILES